MADGESYSADELEYPFIAIREESGLFTSFEFQEGLKQESKDQLIGMIDYFQYSSKLNDKVDDSNGNYLADFTYSEGAHGKNKTKYNSLDPELTITVDQSKHKAMDGVCLLESGQGKEQLTFKYNSDFYLESSQKYSFDKEDITEGLIWGLSSDIDTWPPINVETKPSLLEIKQDEKELLSLLMTGDLSSIDAYDLAALLNEKKYALDGIKEYLAEDSFTNRDAMRFYHSLGIVDNSFSHSIITYLLGEESVSDNTKFLVTQALLQGEGEISRKTYTELEALLNVGISLDRDINNSYLLALGSMVQYRDGEEVKKLNDLLSTRLTESDNPNEKAKFITSLTNTADEKNIDLISSYHDDSSVYVQRNVAKSLGKLTSEKAQETLEDMLHSSSNPSVINEVVQSLGSYELEEEVVGTLLDLAARNDNDQLRYSAIEALGHQDQHTDVVQEELRKMLATERSRKNFQAIVDVIEK
ncbi:HEAT repeat domain-containing protein [Vibrio sp. RE86]|uniref:HEAT repeat domain-containing protein n=1 Tax=Vibrio sp. RE86 TaxID=2607605 RepID=UPI001493A4F3|nr:HEAT repeat domain-containing protein [Vibrio sp. RE86]